MHDAMTAAPVEVDRGYYIIRIRIYATVYSGPNAVV